MTVGDGGGPDVTAWQPQMAVEGQHFARFLFENAQTLLCLHTCMAHTCSTDAMMVGRTFFLKMLPHSCFGILTSCWFQLPRADAQRAIFSKERQ